MTSASPHPDDHAHDLADLPPINQMAVAEFLREEAATYLDAGEFYFRNPKDLGVQLIVNWLNDVAASGPERRWGTLEMLTLYGLSAVASTGGFPLTDSQRAELVSSVAAEGPLKAELEHAALDAISLLQSGMDPEATLPPEWAFYRHVMPAVFATSCLVFAILTLETVREAATEDQVDPAVMWREWLTTNAV